MVPEQPT